MVSITPEIFFRCSSASFSNSKDSLRRSSYTWVPAIYWMKSDWKTCFFQQQKALLFIHIGYVVDLALLNDVVGIVSAKTSTFVQIVHFRLFKWLGTIWWYLCVVLCVDIKFILSRVDSTNDWHFIVINLNMIHSEAGRILGIGDPCYQRWSQRLQTMLEIQNPPIAIYIEKQI